MSTDIDDRVAWLEEAAIRRLQHMLPIGHKFTIELQTAHETSVDNSLRTLR
jgi:hypothetical protein